MSEPRTVPVWQERVRLRVHTKGNGPALVYFHGPWGLVWDPFLDHLARDFTVYAPEHPGTTPGAPDEIYQLEGLWDLVLCYDELLEALGIEQAVLVGHSFGGMVACELAATAPRRAKQLVLIDPIGFWREAEPVINFGEVELPDTRRRLFRDPDGEAAQRLFGKSDADPDARVRVTWALGATGKFIWPIPDKGLKKRIHRVKAPALLVWGKEDTFVPPIYADEFTRRLPGARLQTIDQAGHAPHLDQPDTVARIVREFVNG
jgi:pimeloyl-ACP methyl ester carboxylesterase